MQINILESKNRLSQLVRLAQQGEEVIIANRGIPAVKLVPVSPASDSDQLDILAWLDKHPLPQVLRRSGQEIDDALAQERRGWD
ncbi:type II toxin-antitoxin system prevent-host-death family antitoxin [Acidithiobacillus thiooxidans]|uniref:Antitoxin n=1 Tax=Acidithiobacillus thiooxidans ATCC 19377 TaxID=637390 RepID=A0A5P9XTR7_ACITH|nr:MULTISPECIES: type II toxin-antitoxin system prevent-host-death family antitoxin [Acidithiobacillus]MBU2740783.1 type II toxin-antitoxin system prevent-host-death family antitoxin [Acidithiobacillus albertensis]MBU2793057.1 type II toxin-antitoxin system prevent-host-death family antitoxin [Acidithiobacillus thiooxidans]MBU2834398.1 type II toxin-antitoxin system prevent-host-death family antitoxin [Acidithiobacillus thiooxidans]MDA8177831.1 type II toxin-antitoxin system prevent-host-death 